MSTTLQDYFSRLTAVNRQRAMTGNQQYNTKMDASLAEGYFDTYSKNKLASQELSLKKDTLAAQKEYNAADIAYKYKALDQTTAYNTAYLDAYNKNLSSSNLWQGLGLGAYAGTMALQTYNKWKTTPALEKPVEIPAYSTTEGYSPATIEPPTGSYYPSKSVTSLDRYITDFFDPTTAGGVGSSSFDDFDIEASMGYSSPY